MPFICAHQLPLTYGPTTTACHNTACHPLTISNRPHPFPTMPSCLDILIDAAESADGKMPSSMPKAFFTASLDKKDTIMSISALLKEEEQHMCHHDYLRGSSSMKVAVARRAKVCQWIFDAVHCFRLHRETAIVAISYLDRFLCSSSKRAVQARCNPREYQLVAMACLYIAIKISSEVIEIDASTISGLSRGLQTAEDIISCSRDILASLRWEIQGPTPFQYVSYMLELLPDDTVSMEVATKLCDDSYRQVELAVEDYACVILRRSSVAVGSFLNSLSRVAEDDFPSNKRNKFIDMISKAFELDVLESQLIKTVRGRLLDIDRSLLESNFNSSEQNQESILSKPLEATNVEETPICLPV
mgnify:CR=1 FL=1